MRENLGVGTAHKLALVCIGALVACALAIAGTCVAPAHAHAKVVNKTIVNVAPGGYKYPVNYTYSKTIKKYDITGDKKADKLTFKVSKSGKTTVYVNGKKVRTFKCYFTGQDATFVVKYLKLKNNKPFLFVRLSGVNMDGYYAVVQYKKGKLRTITTDRAVPVKYCTAHHYIRGVKAAGNSLKVTYQPMTFTAGSINVTYTFKWNKKAKTVKRTSSTTSSVQGSYPKGVLKALHPVRSIKVYSSASLKKRVGTIAAGKQLKITKVAIKGGKLYFKAKATTGTSGWFKGSTKGFGMYNGGTLFRETYLAG